IPAEIPANRNPRTSGRESVMSGQSWLITRGPQRRPRGSAGTGRGLVFAHVAGLVLLAAAAPAGIVPAELRPVTTHGLDGLRLRLRGAAAPLGHATRLPAGPVALAIRPGGVGRVGPLLLGALLRLRLALLLQALEILLARTLHAAERVHHRRLDALERDLEEREAFA